MLDNTHHWVAACNRILNRAQAIEDDDDHSEGQTAVEAHGPEHGTRHSVAGFASFLRQMGCGVETNETPRDLDKMKLSAAVPDMHTDEALSPVLTS